jgi:23S rRNA pseudouridine2605 synthase
MLRESKTNAWFEVILHEGRNQQVRRMFDAIGHSVIKLVRTRIGNLEEKNLKPGRWRKLNEREVKTLKGPHQTRTATKRNIQSKTRQRQTKSHHPPKTRGWEASLGKWHGRPRNHAQDARATSLGYNAEF